MTASVTLEPMTTALPAALNPTPLATNNVEIPAVNGISAVPTMAITPPTDPTLLPTRLEIFTFFLCVFRTGICCSSHLIFKLDSSNHS